MKLGGVIRSSSASTSRDASSVVIAKRPAPLTPSNLRQISRWESFTGRIWCMRKQDLLIDGPGKYPGYNYWRVAGVKIGGKDKGEAAHEAPPVDVRSLLP